MKNVKNKKNELTQEDKVKTIAVFISILGLFVYWVWSSEPEKELRPEKKEQQLVKHCFSVWNGSRLKLLKVPKDNMNDPRSFEHIETLYGDYGDILIISMKYRGENQFGGEIYNYLCG